MLFIKGIYLLLSHLPTSPAFGGCLTPPSATHRIAHPHHPPSSSDCANGAIHHHAKTAEERFNMLARGWLAYPVMPTHALLPPKSGCRNVIPRFALSRRRATALFRNPVCKAQRSVPGFSSTPTSACRRYATSPPSAVAITHRIAYPHHPPSSSDCAIGAIHHHRRKTAEERFNMLARGWLAYPVTPTHHQSTAEERLYKRHPSVCLAT